jgi:hypothetical protein
MSVSSLGASWVFSFQPVLPPDFRVSGEVYEPLRNQRRVALPAVA